MNSPQDNNDVLSKDAGEILPPSEGDLKKKAEILKIPFLTETPKKIKRSDLAVISEEISRKYQMAVFKRTDGLLKVAMTNPQDIEALNILRFVAEKDRLKN